MTSVGEGHSSEQINRKDDNEHESFAADEGNDEESRLRARLLAKKAELMRGKETVLDSTTDLKKMKEKHHHHHKKKKKRRGSGSPQDKVLGVEKSVDAERPSSFSETKPTMTSKPTTASRRVVEIENISIENVISAKIAERVSATPIASESSLSVASPSIDSSQAVTSSSTTVSSSSKSQTLLKRDFSAEHNEIIAKTDITYVATKTSTLETSYEEELESLGPNIQPPQAFSSKKFRKRDKRWPEDDRDRSPRSKRTQMEEQEPNKSSRQQMSVDEKAKPAIYGKGGQQKHVPYQDSGPRLQSEDSKAWQEKLPKTQSDQDFRYRPNRDFRDKLDSEERRKFGFPDKYRKEARYFRADERRRRSRSPFEHRGHTFVPMSSAYRAKRPTSPVNSRSRSRENRWLPKLAGRLSPQSADSQQQRKYTTADRTYDRPVQHTSRVESLYGPPPPEKSPAPATSVERKPSTSTTAVAQTPTLDEMDDQTAGLLKRESDKIVDSPASSTASPTHSPYRRNKNADADDSLESGEQRSGTDENRKENIRQKYSKFESSPEMDVEEREFNSEKSENESADVEENQEEKETDSVEGAIKKSESEKSIAAKETRPTHEDHSTKSTAVEGESAHLPVYYPATMGCRSVEEFQNLNKIEEGTYGVVYRAVEKRTGEIVALKRLKMEKEKEGFPITSLREINMLLKSGQHENIVKVREIVVGSNMDKIYLVMDYVEHDLKSLMETMSQNNQHFLIGEVKRLMLQLLAGVNYLHDNWILHRDLKTSNLLLSHKGILKIGDFGLAREYGSPLKPYTPIVVTLWYRAPELLLGIQQYSTPIDMWSVGCIFAELLTLKPFFTGKSELEQLQKIFKVLGTPNGKIWEKYDELPGVKKMTFADYPFNSLRKHFGPSVLKESGFNLLNKFLTYDPIKRITAADALKDEFGWFFKEEPSPVSPDMFPTWPAKSERAGFSSLARLPAVRKPPSPPQAKGTSQATVKEEPTDELLAGLKIKPSQVKAATGFSLKFGSHF